MGNIIERLLNAGLEAKFFYSCQRDEVYIKIRVELKRLTSEAGRIGYRLQLDPDRLRAKALLGKKRLGKLLSVIFIYLSTIDVTMTVARGSCVETHRNRGRVPAVEAEAVRLHIRPLQ